MRKGILLVVVATVLAIPAVAIAGGGHTSACRGFADSEGVTMLDSCFDGVAHFASPGGDVSVLNKGSLEHSYTAVDGSFDTGLLRPGASYDVEGVAPGIYRVYCTLHGTASGQGMAGTLIVAAEPGAAYVAPAPAAPDATTGDGGAAVVAAIDAQTEVLAAIGDRQSALLDTLQPAAAGPPAWAWQATILLAVAAAAAVVVLSVGRRSQARRSMQVVGGETG